MEIKYTFDAFVSLIALVNFIESKNTFGAGIRWLNRYEVFLKKALALPEKRKICNNKTLKDYTSTASLITNGRLHTLFMKIMC